MTKMAGPALLLLILTGCSSSAASSEDLVNAYKECVDLESGPIDDEEYTSDRGNSGITDGGNTVWFEGTSGECVLAKLGFPESITRKIDVGNDNTTETWEGYELTWSWQSYDTGIDMIITTN